MSLFIVPRILLGRYIVLELDIIYKNNNNKTSYPVKIKERTSQEKRRVSSNAER